MKISKLKIENFRNIGPLQSFELNPQFTTIIGVNGRGKSTILSAMRIACGSYLLGIVPAKKRHIHLSEIRLEDKGKHLTQQRPVVIAAEGNFDEVKESVYWQRQIPENSNSTTSNEAEVGAVRKLARDKYEKVVIGDRSDIAFPIIAFFGTSRAHGAGRVRSSRIGRRYSKRDIRIGTR